MRIYPTGSSEEDFEIDDIPDYNNEDYYRINQTIAEVTAILHRIKDCVRKGNFAVLDGEDRRGQ